MSRIIKTLAVAAGVAALAVGGLTATSASAAVATTTTLAVSASPVQVGNTKGSITFSASTTMTASPYTNETFNGSYQYTVDGVLQAVTDAQGATISPTCGEHSVAVEFLPKANSGLGNSGASKTVTVDVVGGTCGTDRKPVRPIHTPKPPVTTPVSTPTVTVTTPAPAKTVVVTTPAPVQTLVVTKVEAPVVAKTSGSGSVSFTG
jgi:hypothetical protein